MALRIPLDGDDPHFTLEVDLDGADFQVQLDWNERDSAWYFTLRDSEGEDIVGSQRVASGWPMLRRVVDSRRPAGELVLVDIEGEGAEPTMGTLGVSCVLMYYEASEL